MQASITYSFSVCEKNESLLPTQKHTEENKGRSERKKRRVSICLLIVRLVVVRLLSVKHLNPVQRQQTTPHTEIKMQSIHLRHIVRWGKGL